jgi:hypothetical protein
MRFILSETIRPADVSVPLLYPQLPEEPETTPLTPSLETSTLEPTEAPSTDASTPAPTTVDWLPASETVPTDTDPDEQQVDELVKTNYRVQFVLLTALFELLFRAHESA